VQWAFEHAFAVRAFLSNSGCEPPRVVGDRRSAGLRLVRQCAAKEKETLAAKPPVSFLLVARETGGGAIPPVAAILPASLGQQWSALPAATWTCTDEQAFAFFAFLRVVIVADEKNLIFEPIGEKVSGLLLGQRGESFDDRGDDGAVF
jgi:hypothetical protein